MPKSRGNKKLNCAVIGATGIAGQQFLAALDGHPWFRLAAVAASERSAGLTLGEALRDKKTSALRWWAGSEPPAAFMNLPVTLARDLPLDRLDLVFTAVESDAAREIEPMIARRLPVFSTASAFRMDEDVPLIVAGVNSDHSSVVKIQRENRNWKGYVVPIPNCTTTGLAVVLKALDLKFGVRNAVMTSMQALSGAGRSPGVIGLDVLDNIIPFISGEEEKVQRETGKILGKVAGGKVRFHPLLISATCTRAAVLDGHFETLSVELGKAASPESVGRELAAFRPRGPQGLPSMPAFMMRVHSDPYRPQPRLDRNEGGGMVTSVGRLRPEPLFGQKGVKLVLLSHNTMMGAAKGAVAVAESFVAKGLL